MPRAWKAASMPPPPVGRDAAYGSRAGTARPGTRKGAKAPNRSSFTFKFARRRWPIELPPISIVGPMNLASLWCLDPSVTYLNHGSFGACPAAILAQQAALRLEMEREPVDFLSVNLPARLNVAREALSVFLGAEPADL